MKKVREVIFDHTRWCEAGVSPQMKVNGLTVTFNMPPALRSQRDGSGHELAQHLPPYMERPAFSTVRFPGAPESWKSNKLNTGDFFVPVRPEHGGWLDFNDVRKDAYDVAIRVSMQGICAITGAEDHLLDELRTFREGQACQKHGTSFQMNRYCQQCGYSWEAQNYLPSRTTPNPLLWLDGFRNTDGEVRQMIFTADAERGVAAQLIGDRRTDAIMVTMFRSKQVKLPEVYTRRRPSLLDPFSGPLMAAPADEGYKGFTLHAASATRSARPSGFDRLEVGAGAKIRQRIYADNVGLDHYNDRPDATFRVHFVPEAQALVIIAEGELDLTAGGESALAGLNVGH